MSDVEAARDTWKSAAQEWEARARELERELEHHQNTGMLVELAAEDGLKLEARNRDLEAIVRELGPAYAKQGRELWRANLRVRELEALNTSISNTLKWQQERRVELEAALWEADRQLGILGVSEDSGVRTVHADLLPRKLAP